ncbi:MAG: methyl-accepting chemotaxis protein, partial [Campylobacterales bacterium]
MALVRSNQSVTPKFQTQVSSQAARRTRTLAKQQQMSENIATIANTLLENAQESVSAIEELKSSMEQIATAAEENSGNSDEALKTVNETTANINTMTKTTESAIANILSAGTNVASIIETIGVSVARMQDSVNIAKESSKKSEGLRTSSENIGEAVGFIAKIADQQNLLALNAAIEASRAKEHGKGFAVVANEIRGLAGNSEKNAQFIAELVREIQNGIEKIIKSITATTDIIEKTGENGNRLNKNLEELAKITSYSVEAAKNINTFTAKLLGISAEMKQGGESIAMASSQIASAVEETLSSIAMQTDSLAIVENDVKELAGLAEELKTSTDTVKSAEEIAASAETLSSSIEEIQKSLTEVTKALSEIESSLVTTNSNALRNKEKAEISLDLSRDIDAVVSIVRRNFDILKISFQRVKSTIQTLNDDIRESIREGTGALENLQVIKRQARSVGKTVNDISNIILQLNMLAISGSIESARAGEFGKGFAVVSADIRNLSQDAGANTDKINDIVESMNSEIDNVFNDWVDLLNSQERERRNIENLLVETDRITDQLIDVLDRFQGLKSMNERNIDNLQHSLKGIEETQKAIELSTINVR